MSFHKTSAFPFIVIGLTILLALLIIYTVSGNRQSETTLGAEQTEPTVTNEEYQTSVREVTRIFEENFDAADTDIARLVAVETALADLLSLRVTADYKELHLDLATALSQMQQGLRGEAGALEKGRARYEQALATNPWLR